MERRLTSAVRAAYWAASASNGLAGALLYYLLQAQDEHLPPSRRAQAFQAARDWLRVIRRVDAWSSWRRTRQLAEDIVLNAYLAMDLIVAATWAGYVGFIVWAHRYTRMHGTRR